MLKKTNGATLADVAREAGVSLKTASRVLNATPVAPATAKRVRAAMLLLDYRPNELARSRATPVRRNSSNGLST